MKQYKLYWMMARGIVVCCLWSRRKWEWVFLLYDARTHLQRISLKDPTYSNVNQRQFTVSLHCYIAECYIHICFILFYSYSNKAKQYSISAFHLQKGSGNPKGHFFKTQIYKSDHFTNNTHCSLLEQVSRPGWFWTRYVAEDDLKLPIFLYALQLLRL